MAGSVVFSFGLAPVFALGTDIIVGAAPPEHAGAASGISETGNELGGALGIAILGSIGAAAYRDRVADAVPAGVPPDAAGAARDTLRGAVGAAEELSGPLAGDLLGAAVEAFSRALQLTAGTSAVLVLAAAILVALLLRNVPAGSGSEDPASPKLDAASRGIARAGQVPGATATETPECLVSGRESI